MMQIDKQMLFFGIGIVFVLLLAGYFGLQGMKDDCKHLGEKIVTVTYTNDKFGSITSYYITENGTRGKQDRYFVVGDTLTFEHTCN